MLDNLFPQTHTLTDGNFKFQILRQCKLYLKKNSVTPITLSLCWDAIFRKENFAIVHYIIQIYRGLYLSI